MPLVGDEVHLPEDVTISVLSVEGLRPRRLRLRYRPEGEAEFEELKEQVVHVERSERSEPRGTH